MTEEIKLAAEDLSPKMRKLRRVLASNSENSEGKTLKGLCTQWRMYKMGGDKVRCVCGTPIMRNFEIKNKLNGRRLIVGSDCIKRFGGVLQEVADQIIKVHKKRAIKKKVNRCKTCAYKSYNCKCYEFKFMPCTHCDRILPAQRLQKHINRMHANEIFSHVVMTFGKYEGKPVWKICRSDRKYTNYILENARWTGAGQRKKLRLVFESFIYCIDNVFPQLKAK